MKLLTKLGSRGDTIVEVLIVLAVLGLAFAISSATANRALNQARNAEEHSQALGIIDAQIELLRSAVNGGLDVSSAGTTPFCMTSNSAKQDFHNPPNHASIQTDATLDVFNDDGQQHYPNACVENGRYHKSIVYQDPGGPAESYYTFRVRWDGVGTLGRQQEIMTYRIHKAVPLTL